MDQDRLNKFITDLSAEFDDSCSQALIDQRRKAKNSDKFSPIN